MVESIIVFLKHLHHNIEQQFRWLVGLKNCDSTFLKKL